MNVVPGVNYIHAVTPLVTNALIDRDMVHRQTAASISKHIFLGVQGNGCEEAVVHLLNHIWPNIFTQSPHVIISVLGAIEAAGAAVGMPVLSTYVLSGLFHPARLVRSVYWRIYNNLYGYAADQLSAVYRAPPSSDQCCSQRTHLCLFL